MSAIKGVRRWRTLAKKLVHAYDKGDGYTFGTNLDNLQNQHHSDEDCLKAIVTKFLKGDSQSWYKPPSWRAVIWSLYKSDEIHMADKIRSFGEKLEGYQVFVS